MAIYSYASAGFEGTIISIEVDVRRGIPGIDIVGLPDIAVKEARERIRIAVKRSGFEFPRDRLLVNMAPAGVRKEGASHDLPIAAQIMMASSQLPTPESKNIMILGELMLNGEIRSVKGVLSAVASGLKNNIDTFIIPSDNIYEASILKDGNIYSICHLKEIPSIIDLILSGRKQKIPDEIITKPEPKDSKDKLDYSDLMGQPILRRSMEICAAGMHNILLFGPPGSGKMII